MKKLLKMIPGITLYIAMGFIALLGAATLALIVIGTVVDGGESDGICQYAIDEDIDRLVVAPFSYDELYETKCLLIDSPRMIEQWKKAHKWTDAYAICCDEDTTHKITALCDGERVTAKSYSIHKAYNNFWFGYLQGRLARRLDMSLAPDWQYLVRTADGSAHDEVLGRIGRDEGMYAYHAITTDRAVFYIVSGRRLDAERRGELAREYGLYFALDEHGQSD